VNAIVDAAVARARTVMLILFVAVAAGTASYIGLPKEADPDIPIPVFFVSLSMQGISPQDGERLLVRPMETALQSIEGVEEMTSYAARGHAGVILEFDVDFDKDAALREVQEQVDIARAELPDDAEEPRVLEFNASLFPVVIVALSGNVPERTLYRLAQELEDEIKTIQGVLETNLSGTREELLEVIIDPALMESYAITQSELFNAVSLNNRLIPAGSLDTGEGRFAVNVPGLFETREDVLNLPIRASGDGVVTLGDVAEIRRTFQDPSGYARFNGEPAMAVEVTKRIGANIVSTNREVRTIVDRITADWPDEVHVEVTFDASDWIFRSLDQLQNAILTAISLVMIVIVAALGWRSGFLVGFAIPASFMIGFLLIGWMGMTINMMVMFGMVVSVGILVDGAIVVVEYADRKMSEGFHRREAYALAAKRMWWPIISSTATTLAAFVPMLFWPGVSGEFMRYLPITLIFVLIASLMMALLFLPVFGSLVGRPQAGNEKAMRALAAAEGGDLSQVGGWTGAYIGLISGLIRHPFKVFLVTGALLFSIFTAFGASNNGSLFFVETEPEFINVFVGARGNLSADEARDLVIEVEDILLDIDGVSSAFTNTGTGGGGGISFGSGGGPADEIGNVFVQLLPYDERRPGRQIIQEMRDRTSNIPGIHVEVRQQEQGPPTGKDVQLELRSSNYDALLATTTRIREFMETEVSGLIELEDTRPLPGIEWELEIDRELAGRFGADVTSIGSTVQLVTNGVLIGRYRPDDADDEVDIRARFPFDARSIDQLDQLRVQTREGLVPLSNFVTRRAEPQVTQIDRVDGERVMDIRANVEDGIFANDKIAEIREWLDTQDLDPRVDVVFRGANEEQDETAEFLLNAMLAALFLMFLILITQFNNFFHSFLILLTVVFSTFGVLLGLVIMQQPFSFIMTGTGIVALAGIVVNNNIVLIDTYQRLLKEGFTGIDAIIRSCAQRLLPIFLTTVTTMCGLTPMMFQWNINFIGRDFSVGGPVSTWWVPFSTAVIWGLGFSTILTLLVTPCLLAWWGRVTGETPKPERRKKRRRRGLFGRRKDTAAQPAE
jgi:multidrug efflux pump